MDWKTINISQIKSYLFDDEFKTDRFFVTCLIAGAIGLGFILFSGKVSKSDLVEVTATAKDYQIETNTRSYKQRTRHDYLKISLVEYPAWLKINEVFEGSEKKYLKMFDFWHTKIRFLIKKSDQKKLNESTTINPYSIITDRNETVMNIDVSISKNDFNAEMMKYVCIFALAVGLFYFLGFRLGKKTATNHKHS
jgi:hypothetical protein